MAMKKPTCLNCNSPNIIPIVYGFPDLKLKEQIDNSEVVGVRFRTLHQSGGARIVAKNLKYKPQQY